MINSVTDEERGRERSVLNSPPIRTWQAVIETRGPTESSRRDKSGLEPGRGAIDDRKNEWPLLNIQQDRQKLSFEMRVVMADINRNM